MSLKVSRPTEQDLRLGQQDGWRILMGGGEAPFEMPDSPEFLFDPIQHSKHQVTSSSTRTERRF